MFYDYDIILFVVRLPYICYFICLLSYINGKRKVGTFSLDFGNTIIDGKFYLVSIKNVPFARINICHTYVKLLNFDFTYFEML